MELEESKGIATPVDGRPMMPEPPPVTLVAVQDVVVQAAAGLEVELDRFYVTWLGFIRDKREEGIVYQAENVSLRVEVKEPPVLRDDLRAVQILIPSLDQMERILLDEQVEYRRDKGLVPGQEVLICQDPAGNWVQLGERRFI